MSAQFSTKRNDEPAEAPGKSGNGWRWGLVALAILALLALAGLPMLVPALSSSLSGTTPQAYWYISRACAFVAFGLFWLSMLAGLGITTRLARFWPSMPGSFELHRFTALLGLGFAAIHALVLLGDQYIGYTLGQILVPFMSSNYQPVWVGFGQLALYMLGVVAFSFYVKDRLGTRAWRMLHMLSFALFVLTIAHGLGSGTDSATLPAQALYWGSGASVLFLSIYRIVAVRQGRTKAALPRTAPVALAGRVQTPPAVAVGSVPPSRFSRPRIEA